MTDPVPSKDLVAILREAARFSFPNEHQMRRSTDWQAADEIERQQAQIATLKGYIERTALAGYRCAECAARLTAEPPADQPGLRRLLQEYVAAHANLLLKVKDCPHCDAGANHALPPGAGKA
jgi:hypothetical protein